MTGQYEGLLADLNHFMKRFGPKVFKCQWCPAGDLSVVLTNQTVQAYFRVPKGCHGFASCW